MSRAARLKSAVDLSFGQVLTPRLPARRRRGCEKPQPERMLPMKNRRSPNKTRRLPTRGVAPQPPAELVSLVHALARRAAREDHMKHPANIAGSLIEADSKLFALVQEIEDLQGKLADNRNDYERLLAEYESTLPAMPSALTFTERDATLFFLSGHSVGDSWAEDCGFIAEFKKEGFRRCIGAKGGVRWIVDLEAQQRGDEILAADVAWRKMQNEHSRSIGLMSNCDRADEIDHRIAALSVRIAQCRAKTLAGLQAKARAMVDNPEFDAVRDSIIRDLTAIQCSNFN